MPSGMLQRFKALIWLVGLGFIRGWDGVNLECCWGNGTYVHIVVYNILTNWVRALESTSEYLQVCA